MIIDGKGLVLGRLASFVAKQLLNGERVTIVNAEQVTVSGRREQILESYRKWLDTRNIANPRKGPFHHKTPDALVRMAVRGMLPYGKAKGREAFKRLRVYRGVPDELAGKEMATVPAARVEKLRTRRSIRVGEISRYLGGRA